MQPSKPLCLCGFMGAGKTTLGDLFSKKYHLTFQDLDHALEKELGMNVTEIFETQGEEYFRKKESELLKLLINQYNIIALGGGTLLDESNLNLLLERSKLVYLNKSFTDLPKELPNRPLLSEESQRFLFEQRLPGYLKAPYTLDLQQLDESEIHGKLWQIWSE